MATHSSVLAWRIPMDKRSLVGYSPWGPKELDTNERLSTLVGTDMSVIPAMLMTFDAGHSSKHFAYFNLFNLYNNLSPVIILRL